MGIEKLKLGIFISGRGSNLRAIIEACKDLNFPAEISVVLSNRPDAGGIVLAQKSGIKTEIVDHKNYKNRESFEAEIQARLENHDVDLIILAGFMRILTASFVKKWLDKMVNIHPSLLPDYKGLNTYERAINDGKTESGCTIHFVNADLDSGAIILQKRVAIHKDDTPDSLAARILEQEHKAYPEAIRIIASSLKK